MEGAGGEMAFCKWLIGGLSGFVLVLIAWIKSLLSENKAEAAARLNDVKEQYKHFDRDTK